MLGEHYRLCNHWQKGPLVGTGIARLVDTDCVRSKVMLSRWVKRGRADNDGRARQRAADGPFPPQYDSGLPGSWRDENRRVRVLRALVAGPARVPARRRTAAGH